MNRADYARQLIAVSDFIYDHLDEELELFRLAEVAHVSPYHWHRVYHAMCGETAAATVRRLRLQRAAGYLAGTTMTVREVAAASGFTSTELFSRVFREAYGTPPARYRASGQHTRYQATAAVPADELPPHPVVVTLVPQRVLAGAPHRGSYMDIGRAFARVRHELAGDASVGSMIAIYHDDPDATAEAELRSVAGVEVSADAAVPGSLDRVVLPAGEYAVLQYRGPYASMHAAYTWLYGSWLPSSGRVPADHPVVEEYLDDPAATAPGDLRTLIAILLQPEPAPRSSTE
jgi:AraC family transcriptional regulator